MAECLYRYVPTGTYYARFKIDGKEIRKSLETADRTLANRKLREERKKQEQIDRSKSKIMLAGLCDRYFKTIQHQKPKTNKFGPVSRNLHLACIKEIFAMAVDDRIIAHSPAANIKKVNVDKPIRRTPTFEQFQAIVDCIRSQKFNGHDADESADFVEFIGLAGLGQAEASTLEWPDIDWQREQIVTFRHKTKAGFAIPLYPQLRPLLEKRHAPRTPGDDQVFKIKDAKRAIAAACKRLKLPAFSHRSFRRMFVTRAIDADPKNLFTRASRSL